MSYRADKHTITAHTDGHTDSEMQAMTIPEGQNWPRVIKLISNRVLQSLKLMKNI